MLFNRDLRFRDHPALTEALRVAERVVPLFVLDDTIWAGSFASPNRAWFLCDALGDLRLSLRQRGADLIVRRGDPVTEAVRLADQVGAEAVLVSQDVSRYADRRQARLEAACRQHRLAFSSFPGAMVVTPEAVRTGADRPYRVFTPYWNAWRRTGWRPLAPTPRGLRLPEGVVPGRLPEAAELVDGRPSPRLPAGGETAGRRLVAAWIRSGIDSYPDRHDDLAGDATSRLSPFLHFGCVSPLELARRAADRPGGESFVRQLCWRDFHHQVTAGFGAIATTDYRPRGDQWDTDAEAARSWQQGRTGYPIVDAAMRQLIAEGWMHNRARLIVASFLTKDLHLDWRLGAAHFLYWLVDGDIANNSGNWQWVAGTGNDTRPNRMFNPLRQAVRFDPAGDYVRRHLPELRQVKGPAVHHPWDLPADLRRRLDYPERIVDHDDAVAASQMRRAADRPGERHRPGTRHPA